MIDAGATKFGVGNAVHFHGTAPGFNPAPNYSLEIAGMSPLPDTAPIPTARPDNQPSAGLLAPANVQAAEPFSKFDPSSPVGDPVQTPNSAPVSPVERQSLAPAGLFSTPTTATPEMTGFAAPVGAVERQVLDPIAAPAPPSAAPPAGLFASVPSTAFNPDPMALTAANIQQPQANMGLLSSPALMGPATSLMPPTPTVAPLPPPQTIKDYPVAAYQEPQRQQQPQQQAPSGMQAISGLFSAPDGAQALSRSNPDISFTSLGNGLVEKTNQYGVTSILDPSDYSHPDRQSRAQPQGLLSGPLTNNGIQNPAQAGFMGIPQPQTQLGQTVRGAMGGALGAGMGGLLGPVGALVGGLFGRELAQGRNPFDALNPKQATSALQYTSAFPNAPMGGSPGQYQFAGGSSNRSYEDMASISPAAADAISSGSIGLF